MFVAKVCSTGRPVLGPRRYDRRMPPTTRYRCNACGNLTRFDVIATRRSRAFHHYNLGGDLEIEDEEVLDEQVERVSCRWCSAAGDAIEVLETATAEEA
jgi:hypothetical protein